MKLTGRTFGIGVPLGLLAVLGAASGQAQTVAPVTLHLAGEGLEFSGEVVILGHERRGEHGDKLTFWRPVLYEQDADKFPYAGRMECELAAEQQGFSTSRWDLRERYDAEKPTRLRRKLNDRDVTFEETTDYRRLDVEGLSFQPHRHYVRSYIALRNGELLYDVLMDCDFSHADMPGQGDYPGLVHRYTNFTLTGGKAAAEESQS